ncbi:MAG TPA: ROK family protein [Candidatus Eisenbacteria bacterium]|nr:ROK family protein [Candidatus Eisenbacteria bacterium]
MSCHSDESRSEDGGICCPGLHHGPAIATHCQSPRILILSSVMPDYTIGVDMGGTNLRVAAITTDGQLLEKITLGVKVAMGRDYVIGEMCDAIHSLTDKYRSTGTFVGAGIGVPGIIDVPAGIMRKSANLPGWTDYPVREVIEKRLQTHIYLDNDANVAALGEKWMGAGRDVENMAMLTLGTGIGGAIILNGKIFYGMSGMAGEFGHITVEPQGVLCGCGNRGCSERYASASAVVRMAREAVESGKAPGLTKAFNSDPEFSARSVYNLAIQGDPDAQHIFHRFGEVMGILLADLVNVLDLEMFVIGGGVVSAWDAFAPKMFAELRERSLVYAASAPEDPTAKKEGASAQIANYTKKKTIITQALLGSDAGLYGAARVPLMR